MRLAHLWAPKLPCGPELRPAAIRLRRMVEGHLAPCRVIGRSLDELEATLATLS
jgi:hypothetical protein